MTANASEATATVLNTAPAPVETRSHWDALDAGHEAGGQPDEDHGEGDVEAEDPAPPGLLSTSPPKAGPTARARPDAVDHSPMARARWRGSSNVARMMVRLPGTNRAGPSLG